MTPELIAAKIKALATEYPVGTLVWHRANGLRIIIVGYVITAEGNAVLRGDIGEDVGSYLPCTLSTTKVNADSTVDGEDWKETKS